jgi:hypothetical protein
MPVSYLFCPVPGASDCLVHAESSNSTNGMSPTVATVTVTATETAVVTKTTVTSSQTSTSEVSTVTSTRASTSVTPLVTSISRRYALKLVVYMRLTSTLLQPLFESVNHFGTPKFGVPDIKVCFWYIMLSITERRDAGRLLRPL